MSARQGPPTLACLKNRKRTAAVVPPRRVVVGHQEEGVDVRRDIARRPTRGALLVVVFAILTSGIVVAAAATAASRKASVGNSYSVHNLVSDGFLPADHVDPNLVNAWGIVRSSSSPWWVANNGTDTSTLYDANGMAQFPPTPLIVKVEGAPTGIVFSGGTGFVVSDGKGDSGPARFIFATEAGKIRGWNPAVPPPSLSTHAVVGASRSGEKAIYKGLAIFATSDGGRLYATDFHNARVDMFDKNFHVLHIAGAFVDPNLPQGYAPFGIQNINGNIFVTYSKQDEDAEDEVDGPGLGIVDEYSKDGALLVRVATGGDLNAPWGLAMAPSNFGEFSGDLLVGNFGDGRIHAFTPQQNGTFQSHGVLRGVDGDPITIDGLWGLGFGNGAAAGPTTDLFFAAGPDHEGHGLFGRIEFAPGS
jgi:uncharacterized protein (TIGR03118 family)